jgi:sugar phosphate isomerase/epimerase
MAAKLAAQMYTVREFTKTATDFAASLRKLKAIGYDAAQVSGIGPIEPDEVARILKGEGVTCCVTHVALQRIQNEPEKVIAEHHSWGCGLTAIGGYYKPDATADDWKAFADEFGRLAEKFESGGVRLGYHNHSHELIDLGGGETAMSILLSRCPRSVWFEIDTYWIQHGGADPVDWIERSFGRIPVVHLKDMRVQRNKEGKVEPVMAEVGEGNLNWKRILPACRDAGVQWYAVEQDVCPRDPFDCLAVSLRNCRAMGLE